jgi:hypothetical protein
MIDVIRTMRSAKMSEGSRNPQSFICKSNAIVVSIGGTASGSEDGIAAELKVRCSNATKFAAINHLSLNLWRLLNVIAISHDLVICSTHSILYIGMHKLRLFLSLLGQLTVCSVLAHLRRRSQSYSKPILTVLSYLSYFNISRLPSCWSKQTMDRLVAHGILSSLWSPKAGLLYRPRLFGR